MPTSFRNGNKHFKTDSDEVAKVAIEQGLLNSNRPSLWGLLQILVSALPLLIWLIRLIGGDVPEGP